MLPLRAPRLTYANVVSTLCLVLLLGGGALATAQQMTSQSGEISACYRTKGKAKGAVRLVKAGAKCKKREKKLTWNQRGLAGADAVAPGGAIAFFDLAACPAGWSPYAAAQGRYVVGTVPGGAPGATVGTALGDQENRATGQHAHGITDPGHAHAVAVDPILVGGNVTARRVQGTSHLTGTAQNIANAGLAATTGITVNPAGDVAGTNAPYLQLLACRKD
jgi:hypothetical protein